MATDPVCGMSVDPAKPGATAVHAGTTYYFCCRHCAARFRAEFTDARFRARFALVVPAAGVPPPLPAADRCA